jgi:ribonuclease R
MHVPTESHRLIEHIMIAANEAVASYLAAERVPCLYRVHERPQAASVQRLADQLRTLDIPTPAIPPRPSGSQAADLVGVMSRAVERHVERHGGRMGLTALVLQALQQAHYSDQNRGHAGLGSPCYCHFTSPIRRYPDLVCHRALLFAIGARPRPPRAGELAALGEWTSARERDAMSIERDADAVVRCFALERHLYESSYEETFPGEIVGLIGAGAFIAFGEPLAGEERPFEGMLPVRLLRIGESRRDWWSCNAERTILSGQATGANLRLGQSLPVRVARVDAPNGRVDLLSAM